MATGDRIDPYRAFNFLVQIGDLKAGFHEASVGATTIDPVDYREGADPPLHVRKLTGIRKFGIVSLKRGFTNDLGLWSWYADLLAGVVNRRDGSVTLQDEQHTAVLRWNFSKGWISKWEGPAFNATASAVAIESVELTVEEVAVVLP
jgi:phage tail-like protein